MISGCEHYAEGVHTVKRWWNFRRELKSLSQSLDAEYVIFQNTVEKLLQGLVSLETLEKLVSDPLSMTVKSDLNRQLEIRLHRSYKPYLASVENMVDVLDTLKQKLELDQNGKVRDSRHNRRG